jgi:hypothetical protein
LDLDVVEVVAELRGEGGNGLYVLDQGLLIQRPELRESHCGGKVGLVTRGFKKGK